MSDSPAPCVPITTNLGNSYGALLCGVFLGFMFYGANCLQVFIYLVNYPKDRMGLKVLVGVSWGTDTVHQILGTIGVWQYLVTNFGNYTFLDVTHPLLPLALVFTGIVSTIAQLFLTYRIWLLSGGRWVFPAFLIPAAIVQLVLACIYMAKGLANNTLQNIYAINRYATAVNVLSAVTDITIAAVTCTLLARERANFSKRTDATLARLIILSVNSGLWTSVFALGAAIMALVNDQSNFEYASLQFCMSPLYCNTILSCLNARDFARNGIRKDESNSDSNFYLHSSHRGGAQRPIQLKVSVETEQTIDHDNLDGGQILRTTSRGKQSLNGGFLEP
ncbi:hypothetical protein M405DRAFT_824154 [Rhizopogon salebrosus TDB-379]|nr:hypothetical protein M405DRAFT_824154 [Rhizopogon salebrosus TDB-379]